MSRTVLSFDPEGLRQRLVTMERQLADLQRRGSWQFDVEVVHPETSGGGSGRTAANLVTLAASADSIASGGDYVTFGSIVHQYGFPGVSAAGSSIEWPVSAIGEIQVELAWASYDGGGVIEIEVDGAIPAWGRLAEGAEGQRGMKRRSVDIEAGSTVRIKVTQTSGSAQTADVFAEFVIPDPKAEAGTAGWYVRHFANSDYSPGAAGHPTAFELTSPASIPIPLPADARWPGSDVVHLGVVDLSGGFVFEHTGSTGSILSTDPACIVTEHDGFPTNYDSQHQDISEVTGPGWVLRWETTDAHDAPGADFDDVYTYIWYQS